MDSFDGNRIACDIVFAQTNDTVGSPTFDGL